MQTRIHLCRALTCIAAMLLVVLTLPAPEPADAAQKKAVRQAAEQSSEVHFADITRAAGIHFVHNNGAFGKKYLPETLGPGCAFIDYDNDGYPDILLINGQDWPGHEKSSRSTATTTFSLRLWVRSICSTTITTALLLT